MAAQLFTVSYVVDPEGSLALSKQLNAALYPKQIYPVHTV